MDSKFVIRGIVLCVAALLSMNFAWGQSVDISTSTPNPPTVYGTFTVDVNFSAVPNLMGSRVVVAFDPAKMRYESVANGNVFTAQDPFVNPGTGQITVDQAAFGAAFTGGSGKLFTVTFTALQGGASDITVPTVDMRNELNVQVGPTSGTPRSVAIDNPAPSLTSIDPGSITADHGDVTLTLTGNNFVTSSVVRIDGEDYALASFVSKTQVTTTIPTIKLKTARGYSVTVLTPTPGGGESSAQTLTVTAGAAASLVKFSGDGQSATVDMSVVNPLVVKLTDASGNPVASSSITFAIASYPAGGTAPILGTTSTVTDGSGQASTTLKLGTKSGTYTVTATAAALSGSPVTFSAEAFAGSAAALAFEVQPSNVVSGQPITPAVQVRIIDEFGNLKDSGLSVTLAIGTNAGGGALSGTTTVSASHGVATFSNLSINKMGTGYTLTAASGTLTGATSTPFTVSAGAAAKLLLTSGDAQSATISTLLTNPLVVTVADAADNPVEGTSVTFAIASYPTEATGQAIGTTSTTTNSSGQASTTLTLGDKAGPYTVTATSGSLLGSPVTFTATATAGAATKLTFGVQPSNTTSGATITPAITVRIEDASGNLINTDTRNVTLAIANNPGGGVLSGSSTVAAIAGVATFSTLTIDKAGTGYTLAATSDPALTGATSSSFNITVGAAAKLAFGVQPSNTAAGTAISPAVTVRIEDAAGNLVTGDTRIVTLTIGTNPGTGILSGTAAASAVAGVATFSDLSINKAGTGYTLTATGSPVLTEATSNAFNITAGAFDHYVFSAVSTPQTSGTPFSITVTAVDANLNTVTTYAGVVTLTTTVTSIFPTSGTFAGGVLTLPITVTGSGSCTITVDDGSGHTATSNSFTLTSAPKLFLAVSPTDTTKRIVYPEDNWSSTGYESNDWSIKTNPIVRFYIVPEDAMLFSSYDITLSWVNTELLYIGTVKGNAGGTNYDTASTVNSVRIRNDAASGNNPAIGAGDYLARVDFKILKPGHAAVRASSISFTRSGIGPFAVSPNDGEVKAYLGDVASVGSVVSRGDGKVDYQDLSPWSSSYWYGVDGYSGPPNYKVKYDVGPTAGDKYVYTMPVVDGKIEFEDLIVFSISYGLTANHVYRKPSVPPGDTVLVSLGQPTVQGNETRIAVVLDGTFSDIRAMSLAVDGRFGKFLGVEKGTLLQSYQTPVMVLSRSTERQAFIDLSIVGSNVEGINRPGEAVILRFEGTPQIQLTRNDARSSGNLALPVRKVRGAGESMPTEFALLQNYPNPFNPSTTIEYQLPAETMTTVEIYNMLGERVATLVHDVQAAGFYTVRWNGMSDTGAKVASGVYFYRMSAAKYTMVKKMLLVK